MRTKKPKGEKISVSIFSPSEQKEIQKEPSPSPSAPPPLSITDDKPEVKEGIRKNIAWYEDEKGRIQWDKMRKSTQEALKEFLSRPDVWKDLQIEKPPAPPRKIVGEDLVSRCYDLFGKVESFLASRFVDKDIADKIFLFDEEEKQALVPVTVRLINKRGPDWLAAWAEEIEFGVTFLSIQMSKMFTLRVYMAKERKRKEANAPGPTPILVPEKPKVEEEGTSPVPSAPPDQASSMEDLESSEVQ